MNHYVKKSSIFLALLLIFNLFFSCSKPKLIRVDKPKPSSHKIESNITERDKDKKKKPKKLPEGKSYEHLTFEEEYTDIEDLRNIIVRIDFENSIKEKVTKEECRYTVDALYERWFENKTRAKGILKESHKTVCELNARSTKDSYFSIEVDVPTKSYLSFDIKSDVYNNDVLEVIVDNVLYTIYHKGYGESWKKIGMKINEGKHTITWRVPYQRSYSDSLKNVIYIDNITIVEDKIAFLEITPKGKQETFEKGIPIHFKAQALRGDRSFITDAKIKYSINGGGKIDDSGVFNPEKEGVYTVTAESMGMKAIKKNIIVHQNNYLLDPVTIGENTFTGKVTNVSGESLESDNIRYYYPSPAGVNFNADGFFVLEGDTALPLFIEVSKNGTDLTTYYIIRKPGFFYTRIWLRFGYGDYTIKIAECSDMEFANLGNDLYEGAYRKLNHGIIEKVLNVKNVNPMKEEDAMLLMPSDNVQADSFFVSSVVNSIVAELPKDATIGDKIRAIHDWEKDFLIYDQDSYADDNQRKRQDAESVVLYGMGVCEGYANLFAAMLRNLGVKVKLRSAESLNHVWNHVLYNDKWYLVDVTWDDPVPTDIEDKKFVYSENYKYFMTSFTDKEHTVSGVDETAW